jgi:hypothetical protein
MIDRRTSALLSTLEKGTGRIDTALSAEGTPTSVTEVPFNLDRVCFVGLAVRFASVV